jgi:hypothetical protein
VRAADDLVQGRLDEAAAHLTVAESYAGTAPPERRRLRVAIASLKLSLARRRGHLAGVIEQVRFLASPETGPSDEEDIALGSDLRAVALMNLGTAEAWTLGLPDAERHLREGAVLAREIGRPYLEVGCLAQLGFASKIHPFAITQRRCREAIALAERHGWGTEPVIAPALMTLAGTMVWLGEFDEGERWLQRTVRGGTDRHRAGHQAAAAPDGRDLARRPRPPPRGAAGVQRGRIPGITARGIARAGQPGDQLPAGHPSPSRDDRRSPRPASPRSRTSGPAPVRSVTPSR